MDIGVIEGRAPGGVQDSITIVFGSGMVSGMEIGSGLLDSGNPDCCRQTRVQGLPETGQFQARGRMKMTNLGQRMNSCVGSSGAANMDRLLHNALQRPGQLTLDGSESRLYLPSVVACSIVLDLHPDVSRT